MFLSELLNLLHSSTYFQRKAKKSIMINVEEIGNKLSLACFFFLPSLSYSLSLGVCQAGECPADNTPTGWLYFLKVCLGWRKLHRYHRWSERERERKRCEGDGEVAVSGTQGCMLNCFDGYCQVFSTIREWFLLRWAAEIFSLWVELAFFVCLVQ